MYRVLLVDDEPLTLAHTRSVVECGLAQCEIIGTATNGLEGIEAIRRLKPDVVITDVVMPGATGLELIDATLEESRCHFIVLSGYQEFEYVRHAMRSGAVDYLLKPITVQDLRQAFARLGGEDTAEESYEQRYGSLVAQVIRAIDEHYAEPELSLGWICDNELFMNSTHVGRLFQKRTGQKFTTWLTEKRLCEARQLMDHDRDMSVAEAAERAGFSSAKYFTEVFRKNYGMSPGQYKQEEKA